MKNELRHSNRTRDDSDWRELAAQTRAQRRAKGMSEPQIDVEKVAAEWAEGYFGGVNMSNKNLMNNAWALIIGINNYEQNIIYGPLECCVPDAIGLYILLTHPECGGINPDQVCLLIDGTDDYIKRIAEDILQQMQGRGWLSGTVRSGIVTEISEKRQKPTRERILHEMNRWAHTVGSDDWLLVHYAGHGDVFNNDIYLIPPSAHFPSLSDTAITLSRMKELMRGSKAWAKVLSLDACYSGSAVSKKVPHPTTEESQRMVLADGNETAILTSCLPYERAMESGSLSSVFGEYLLEGLSGVADEREQNLVTFLDLYRYVEPRVKRWAASVPDAPTQTPFLHAPGVLSYLALTGSEAAAHNAVLKGAILTPPDVTKGEADFAFVLMPIGEGNERKRWKEVYDCILKPSISQCGFRAVRSDEFNMTGNLVADIVIAICKAKVVIADITGLNPNVMYELGIAHVFAKRVLIVTQNKQVPILLGTERHIFYDESQPQGGEPFQEDISTALGRIKGTSEPGWNAVQATLPVEFQGGLREISRKFRKREQQAATEWMDREFDL